MNEDRTIGTCSICGGALPITRVPRFAADTPPPTSEVTITKADLDDKRTRDLATVTIGRVS